MRVGACARAMTEIYLINILGADRQGLTAELMQILAGFAVQILDIGQAVIHDQLTLGILVEIPAGTESSHLLKDVLFLCHERELNVRFTLVPERAYEEWVAVQGRSRFIVTLLARKITARHMQAVAGIISEHGLNIEDIQRLSGRVALEGRTGQHHKACIELNVRGEPADLDAMRRSFLEIAITMGADIAFQRDDAWRRNRRLVCFDMDSTLIETEVIDELARCAGVGAEVSRITEQAMNGQLDFRQSFIQRVGLLAGLDAHVLEHIASTLPLTEGAEILIATLKKLGFKTAILSGGFSYFGQALQQRLGIDYVFANQLEIVEGKVTGRVVGEVIDGPRKASLLRELAAREGLVLEQVIAVGDGANDLPMLSLAGLGIAFHAKPLVRATAQQAISNLGLDSVLYLLGVSDRDHLELHLQKH